MAGALIIKGNRVHTSTRTGDLDTLLDPIVDQGSDYPDVLLFQQIPYACFKDGKIAADSTGRWICQDGEIGEVKDFGKQFEREAWKNSGRYTSINGSVQPRIQMEAGRVYRWRLIDAGVRESIGLRIVRVSTSAKQPERLTTDAEKTFIEQQCNSPVVEQFEVAADGLTRGEIYKRETNRLQPGYRSDVLFAFPSAGEYCLYDAPATASGSITAAPENPRLLGWVSVKGGKSIKGEVKDFILARLLESANRYTDSTVRAKVKEDLKNGLKLTSFIPHPAITDAELKGSPVKKVNFNITRLTDKFLFEINGQPYSAGRIDHTLILGSAQEWELTSAFANHPFHIHVNPFQITSILNEKGEEVDPEKDPAYAEYAGMKGVWKDTLLVQETKTKVLMLTRYERYIGDFVLHCHILDHEDRGMMQNVRITLPDGQGGATAFGHAHH